MKKISVVMLIIFCVFSSVSFASVSSKETILNYVGITLNIDNVNVVPRDATGEVVMPFIIDGTTYLPVRAVAEALGKNVDWNASTKTVIINEKDEAVDLKDFEGTISGKVSTEKETIHFNDIKININGVEITPKDANGESVEPFIINGTTYLPVRAVAEALNKKVNWNGETKTVFISSDDKIASITNVVVKIIDGVTCAQITSNEPINEYKYYSLEEPNRLIIDLKDSSLKIDNSTQNISYDGIKQIRFGMQENNVSRIVLDMEEIGEYKVVQSSDRKTTYLALSDKFAIPNSDIKDASGIVASNDDKIYFPSGEENTSNKNDENNTDISQNEQIESGDISQSETENDESGDVNSNDNTNNEVSKPFEDETKSDENETINDKKEDINDDFALVNSIKYSSSTNKTKIKIDGEYEYNIFSLTNPDRVVLDIKNAKLNIDGPTSVTPNNKNIKAIRFSQNDTDVVRIVFDINFKSDYLITEKNGELQVELEEKTYQNIDYINYGSYATLVLQDTDIDYFDVSKSTAGNKYYITYSSKKFKTGTGTIEVDDDFVSEIVVKSTKITIWGESDVSYSIKQVGDDVVVTIKSKKSSDEESKKVILLDAGHGGTDPGACNGTTYEKDYNLKIALKLYEMLKETDEVEVRISRDSDVFINRDGRLEYIIDNDDADLFVSIHNNSLANKNYKGTMVLYYNKPNEKEDYGITSKEFALLVKENLIEKLGTVDRGVVNRDDLWVLTQNNLGERPDLKTTNIPSILCEVIYISNDEEAARLRTDEFQQSTAQAIYDGIIEAIDVMENE